MLRPGPKHGQGPSFTYHGWNLRANTAKAPEGSGLGLVITQEIALLHGSSIQMHTISWGSLTVSFKLENSL